MEINVNRSWRTGWSLGYTEKENRNPINPSLAQILKVTNTQRAFLWNSIQVSSSLELRSTKVNGNSGAVINYKLTDGTGKGSHLIWAVSGTYRISNLVRLNFNYDGRTINNRPDIHTIKMVISAVF
jgi:hypothetical protein